MKELIELQTFIFLCFLNYISINFQKLDYLFSWNSAYSTDRFIFSDVQYKQHIINIQNCYCLGKRMLLQILALKLRH